MLNGKKIVALVPMKLNNVRLPGKNIKCFEDGKPLCHYILTTLLSVDVIDEVYVYCSNESIKDYIPEGVIYRKRSESLDQNTTKINEVIKAFASEIPAEIYVMTHATSPFVGADSILKGIQAVAGGEYDSSFAVQKIGTFVWKDGHPFNYDLDNIPRTQDLPPMYAETSGFYIFKPEVICELNRRIGNNPYMVEVGQIEATDVDEAEDFLIANAIYNNILKNDSNR